MNLEERILCRYDGDTRGPLLICIGGIHGNEPAGVRAIQIIDTLLRAEPDINPNFVFHGRLLGLAGNIQALRSDQRFIKKDMNRSFDQQHVRTLLGTNPEQLEAEDKEIFGLVNTIKNEIADYAPDEVVILDIHSTSARGGIFVITSGDRESVRIGKALHAPVVLDFVREVNGTTLGYFIEENLGVKSVTVVFESGQHIEPLSVNRAIAAIINCMRTIGCVSPDAVENKHDQLLQDFSKGLPRVTRVLERHQIAKGNTFQMVRAFENFTPVEEGQILAIEQNQPVRARYDGLILLPRLQDQGDDGFFIVRSEEITSEEGITT